MHLEGCTFIYNSDRYSNPPGQDIGHRFISVLTSPYPVASSGGLGDPLMGHLNGRTGHRAKRTRATKGTGRTPEQVRGLYNDRAFARAQG